MVMVEIAPAIDGRTVGTWKGFRVLSSVPEDVGQTLPSIPWPNIPKREVSIVKLSRAGGD
jgi:hypothetical protein